MLLGIHILRIREIMCNRGYCFFVLFQYIVFMTAERIKNIQLKMGYTAQQMADVLGVSYFAYRNWIYNGNGNPSAAQVKALENLEANADRDEFKAQLTNLMVGGAFIALAYLLDPENKAHKPRANPSKRKRSPRQPTGD